MTTVERIDVLSLSMRAPLRGNAAALRGSKVFGSTIEARYLRQWPELLAIG
jgi:hypothetical protein